MWKNACWNSIMMIQEERHGCYFNVVIANHHTFTCSKSTIKTLEKGVKYFQRLQWRLWRLWLCFHWTNFTPFPSVSSKFTKQPTGLIDSWYKFALIFNDGLTYEMTDSPKMVLFQHFGTTTLWKQDSNPDTFCRKPIPRSYSILR